MLLLKKWGSIVIIILCSLNSLFATRFYVDGANGDNSWNGLYDSYQGGINGPKKTINAALTVAVTGDNVEIAGGNYAECLTITKSLNFFLSGSGVSIKCLTINGVNIALNISCALTNTDFSIADSLALVNGKIEATDPKVNFLLQETCKIRGGNKKSFVDNRLWIASSVTSATGLFFPVGSGPDYRPVTVSVTQSSTSTNRYMVENRASAPSGLPGPGIRNISRVHFWTTRYSGSATASDFKLKIAYDSAVNDDECPQPANLRVVRQMGGVNGPWINIGGVGSNAYVGNITNTVKLDTIGRFTLGNVISGTNPLGRKGPITHFGWVGNCEKTKITFKDSSFSYKLPITRRKWDFGTGNPADTSKLINADFTFPSVGPFAVRLIVWTADGSDTLVRTVILKPRPVAAFTLNNVCLGTPIPFKSNSTLAPPDTILTYNWNLGNASTRNIKAFTYNYPSAGSYKVTLIVTAPAQCADTLSKNITVNSKPNPNFVASKICFGETTSFTGSGGSPTDTIQSWQYFIDGVLETGTKNFQKAFAFPKSYDVKLIVSSQLGCKDTTGKPVIIYRKPQPAFYLTTPLTNNDSIQCFEGNKFTFTNASTTFQGQVLTYKWLYGSPFAAGSSIVQSAVSGNVPVKLIATSDKGCKDSVTQTYVVRDDIKVKFGTATYCLPKAAEFTDSSTAGSQVINTWKWKFGDGNTASTKNSTNTYLTGGSYTVKLIVSTDLGCSDSLFLPVLITSKPTITLTRLRKDTFCFNDSQVINVSGGISVKWNDNDTSRRRAFKNAGVYKVSAYTSPYCFVSDSFTLVRHPQVFADAGPDTFVIKGRSMLLKADGGARYEWTPRNLCTTPDSSRTFVKPGTKTIYYLKVIDFTGCIGYDSVAVDVRMPDFIRIPNLITPNNDNKNDEWDLREIPDVQTCKIQIFTNRGDLVKTLSNYNHDWKGSNETGNTLPNGAYYYIVTCPGEKEPYKGYLHILK